MSSATSVTCPCTVCSNHIEFDPAHAGQIVPCPHCGMETVLFIPSPEDATLPARAPRPPAPRLAPRQVSRRTRYIVLGILAVLLLSALIGWAGIKYLASIGPAFLQASGGILVLLAFMAIVVLILWVIILWLIFPVFMYYGMRRIQALLAQIEQNTRPAKESHPSQQSH